MKLHLDLSLALKMTRNNFTSLIYYQFSFSHILTR